ncbi:putative amidase [Xylaria bambusicola]|uniref:putative amidase n=1 Tax=Xylaria bambusicola TaxID=326684 RepID=UPI0020078EAB|nr:putative amidase [Xylaria bambusicola]KAI0517462.1 putative amidase [Xylaria bambusicola]
MASSQLSTGQSPVATVNLGGIRYAAVPHVNVETNDDVFSSQFLSDIIIIQGDSLAPGRLAEQWSTPVGTPISGSWVPKTILQVMNTSRETPDGPYLLSKGFQLSQAWRLYPDKQRSFITSFIPFGTSGPERNSFKPLDIRLQGVWTAIAVPSRLYSKKSPSMPLAGMRFSVKDNYKISGVPTTQSNRAWCELYEAKPETETAAYVEKLISLGAVFVGKTKMCSFASSEEATDQWIDFHAPFNPRGDGYQSPSGSTTGGGTSLAAYDWLDYSIGTDTTGSIRWPAAWCGLFGLRTTWTPEAMEGVYPACRSIAGMQIIVDRSISNPGALITDDHVRYFSVYLFPMANAEQQKLVEGFVSDLESYLGVHVTRMSIAERWKDCPPGEAAGKTIQEFIDKAAYNPFYYDGYHEYSEFREEYETKFGKPVYVGPYMRWKWDRDAEVDVCMKEKSLQDVEVYRRYPSAPVGPFTWNYIASIQGLPQLVAPIGSIPYESRVTKATEQLPVVGTIIGAAGSDAMLVDIVQKAFEKNNRPRSVLTGRFMFSEPSKL